MKACIIGLGYVGLPTAALAAAGGHMVFGYDSDPTVRTSLQTGRAANSERELRVAVAAALREGLLSIVHRVTAADIYVICVPTPVSGDRPDLRFVEAALADVCAVVGGGQTIVLESTVPPGSTERLLRRALHAAGKSFLNVHIAHAPERILPGDLVRELRENDRVIGGRTLEDAEIASEFYASFVRGRIHLTDLRTAEFVKVVENTYRDVNIAFANELALFCEEHDIDVWQAIALANNHPRVDILRPGPGVGGHCIPIDPRFLADQNPFATELIQASRRVNERMPNLIVRRIVGLIGEGDGDRKVTLLGASYKANVDDVRESPARRIADLLAERGFLAAVYDPVARPVGGAATLEEAADESDAIVLAVNHDAFRPIDPLALAPLMRSRVLVDCHNFFAESAWSAAGFRVYGLGRGSQLTFPQTVSRRRSSTA